MKNKKNIFTMSLGALGIVFGDIGTSPLYAINEIFFSHKEVIQDFQNIVGSISLVVWALIVIISIKYLFFVLRADNDGEGGVFALYGLLYKFRKDKKYIPGLLTILILSAGLLFGDGMITPAISVLSAVEGLKFVAPEVENYVIPITILILTSLFVIQRQGTAKVGYIFGPIIFIWFIVIGTLGFKHILDNPEILVALNPVYGLHFLMTTSSKVILFILGGVVLAISGGEALYADMGHFGKNPIRLGWFLVVFPALILNYLGQGAYLLSYKPILFRNLFYSTVPTQFLLPMVILATFATVIASQALISGAFSLASQAVALGLFPRIKLKHTHQYHEGQVYTGLINWILYIGAVGLVLNFKTSTKLGSAYGLAASVDMCMTSIAMIFLSKYEWKWNKILPFFIFGAFAFIDLHLVIANSHKFLSGGFIPLSIGLLLFFIMRTWRWGRQATFAAYSNIHTSVMQDLIIEKKKSKIMLEKNVILMVPKPIRFLEQNTPALLKMVQNRHGLLPRNLIFVEVVHKKVPYLHENRCDVTIFDRSAEGLVASVAIKFGFMEDPNIEKVLLELVQHKDIDLDLDPHQWIVHVSQENLLPSKKIRGYQMLKYRVFALLRQISRPAYYYYGLGDEVQLSVEIIPVRI